MNLLHEKSRPTRRPCPSLLGLIEETIGNPVRGCEVGVYRGQTSFKLLDKFPDLFLYMVDCWHLSKGVEFHTTMPKSPKTLRLWYRHVKKRTKDYPGRCEVLLETSDVACEQIVDDSLDFVFLDAEHTYPEVKRDCQKWVSKVRPGGLFAGHDYPGGPGFEGQVKQAVDEWFCKSGYGKPKVFSEDIWYLVKPGGK